ncbi:expressed hypothetical protein [Trichoplax adhaerens]|uniref:Saposin B-type domain-containing protein n=1 Tax=Trichoplax adhaerens TaxID=10228 RepID=B3S649_TRIAD|nr:expressed hypothetical protein [Trichoplax adhaerens]EDV21559.1 expressed hypothetical protein [Trichoplax adhaerens]|eukprot:XP_002115707.1 expressed hypothetical protein [Trichoplax adhaerens]
MCSNSALPLVKLFQAKSLQSQERSNAVSQPERKNSGECGTCALVINVIDQLLGNNATETQILHTVDQVCGIFPSDTRTTCKAFMEDYGAAVLRLLFNKTPPKEICSLLGLCSNSKPKLEEKVGLSGLCTVCEIAVQYIDSLLTQNATEQEIISTLDKVCNFLPGSLESDCNTFVKKYAPAVIALLASEISNPKEVCSFLGLCSNSSALTAESISNMCKKGPKVWCLNSNFARLCKSFAQDIVIGNLGATSAYTGALSEAFLFVKR